MNSSPFWYKTFFRFFLRSVFILCKSKEGFKGHWRCLAFSCTPKQSTCVLCAISCIKLRIFSIIYWGSYYQEQSVNCWVRKYKLKSLKGSIQNCCKQVNIYSLYSDQKNLEYCIPTCKYEKLMQTNKFSATWCPWSLRKYLFAWSLLYYIRFFQNGCLRYFKVGLCFITKIKFEEKSKVWK